MRKLKFRGYNKSLKRWFYGGYFKDLNDSIIVEYDDQNQLYFWIVDPDTVGEFTGKYAEDEPIYTGDFLRVSNPSNGVLAHPAAEVYFDENKLSYRIRGDNGFNRPLRSDYSYSIVSEKMK